MNFTLGNFNDISYPSNMKIKYETMPISFLKEETGDTRRGSISDLDILQPVPENDDGNK